MEIDTWEPNPLKICRLPQLPLAEIINDVPQPERQLPDREKEEIKNVKQKRDRE